MFRLTTPADQRSLFGLLVHFKVLWIIINVIRRKIIKNFTNVIISLSFKIIYYMGGLWILDYVKTFVAELQSTTLKRKQAIIILTKISTRGHHSPQLAAFIGKQNAYFLERLMTENLAFMLTNLKKELLSQNKEISLFICYQHRYFYKYDINDWLEHLPDYSKRLDPVTDIAHSIESRFNLLKDSFEKNLTKVDMSFDAASFCATSPVKCSKSTKSIFKYVCVEDAEDGRALEAAIRVGFYHDNQDVIVLNPHAVEMRETHIKDSLSFLETNIDMKNRIIFGKTHNGGLYLVGVSRSRDTLLNIRRLTNNVIWGSTDAYSVISEHESKLNWSGACLRSVLEDVHSIESLPLVERHLGLQLEHIPSDMISVVIPTFNHEEYIEETLEALVHHLSGKRSVQIVVIDASSTDYTGTKLEEFKKNLPKYLSSSTTYTTKGETIILKNCLQSRLKSSAQDVVYNSIDLDSLITMKIHSLPLHLCQRREEQVRYAVAKFVKGGTILLLRPGTKLPLYWDLSIRRCLNRLGVIMGTFSFHLHLHDRYIERKNIGWALRCYIMNWIFNVRSKKYEMPSGDQGFFMYTYYYRMLNHDREKIEPAVLDDIALIDLVKTSGHISTCDASVTVSPIKALQFGFCRSWFLDCLVIIAYRLGTDPDLLEKYCNDLMVVKPDYFDGY